MAWYYAIPIVVVLAIGYYVLYKLYKVAGNVEHSIDLEYHEPTPEELQAWE